MTSPDTALDALAARFLRGLSLSPGSAAVVAGGASVTYTAAHERALLWAGALPVPPSGPRAPVGVLAGRGVDAYLAILACVYAGVPVVPLLADFPAARSRHMLRAAGVSALIVDDAGLAALGELELGDEIPVLVAGRTGAEKDGSGLRRLVPDPAHALAEPRTVASSDVAYVLFTSGSTGSPKGVRLTHGNMAHYFRLMDEWYDFTADDVFSQAANLNWDSAVSDLWCAWGAGATLVSVPAHAYRDMPAFLAEHHVSVWFSAPSAIALIRRMGGLGPGSLPSLRWTYFGGEALKCDDADDWQRAAPHSAVVNVYGPTEMTITTHRHLWRPEVSRRLGVNGVVPLGVLHEGHEQLLLSDDGQEADDEGELCLWGPQLSAGYLDPEHGRGRCAEWAGRTWYRTGDRVRRTPGGDLVYLGRIDAQVQIQGLRVELAEIDHAVRGCTGVVDAVTVTRHTAQGTELFVFYTGDHESAGALGRAVSRQLPSGMVPRHYHHLDEFPLNPNRKIDRLVLARRAQELLTAVN
ncbi:AMP-binding protein [Streptomyces sp. NBC_01754]|uniref:AMP-binding protein n=1 Tax=Streptomyces sp. NBC_01754 TaxID=2975930 RepID=UPI002DDAF7CC|nr:AMP-binding protein [Streptomyces sp. NBC_01754]WSC94329.1 AMP-binding protein [Streptomyces sp. NBC_01754]